MSVKQLSFAETRPMRQAGGKEETATFVLVDDPSVKGKLTMSFGGHELGVYNTTPDDFDRKYYFVVYMTMWNNFAAYGDEKNSNQAYELACYVDYKPQTERTFEQRADIINDFVSALAEKFSKDSQMHRVSHVIYRKAGSPSMFEQCYQKALKPPKIRVWEGLVF